MRVELGFDVRDGQRVLQTLSIPFPSERDRQDVFKKISWVLQQKNPSVDWRD